MRGFLARIIIGFIGIAGTTQIVAIASEATYYSPNAQPNECFGRYVAPFGDDDVSWFSVKWKRRLAG